MITHAQRHSLGRLDDHAAAVPSLINVRSAAVMTLVIGFAALVLLQRSILRHMAATRRAPGSGAQLAERSRMSAAASLALVAEDPAAAPSTSDRTPLLRVALAHTVAGL